MFENYGDMLIVDDICEMLGVGKSKAYRLLKEEQIHGFRIGRLWKISKQSVIDYVKSNTKDY